jgi:hypothetical protein
MGFLLLGSLRAMVLRGGSGPPASTSLENLSEMHIHSSSPELLSQDAWHGHSSLCLDTKCRGGGDHV